MLKPLLENALLKAANKQKIAKHPPLELTILKLADQYVASDGSFNISLESEAPCYANIIAHDYEF